jgi:uncharacterized protein YjiS (DUF1127 family)
VVTTMDPKPNVRKAADRPNSALHTPNDASLNDRPATVIGRDLQVLRDVLSLHLVDPQGGARKARSFVASSASDGPLVRQAAVKAAGDRFLQLYVCTPLDGKVEDNEPAVEAPADTRSAFRFFDIRRIWHYFLRLQHLKQQRDQLMSMNDYMLRDIGIENRMEVAGLLRGHRQRM